MLPTRTGEETPAVVDIKHRATGMTPVKLERWRVEHPLGSILGLDHVTPLFGQRLQAAGIEYVDTAGNAHIDRPGLYVHVEGRRPDTSRSSSGQGHLPSALGPASLRVVFALLVDPALAGASFDVLAEVAGVAKGTVHNTITDLTAQGYLTGYRHSRHLLDTSRLAEKWVDGYVAQLLPRLKQRALSGPEPQWWTQHANDRGDIVLGGGPALAHYGGRLRPDITIIYATPPWNAARKLGRLQAHGRHNVILREQFWSPMLRPNARYVHPLLAYADALAGGDSREIEVARDLRQQVLTTL
jgi:hypothetical protein